MSADHAVSPGQASGGSNRMRHPEDAILVGTVRSFRRIVGVVALGRTGPLMVPANTGVAESSTFFLTPVHVDDRVIDIDK